MFKALVLDQLEGKTLSSVKEMTEGDLPDEPITVAVRYSSINFKDGLAVTGKGKIVHQFPMIPGIDLVGEVIESKVPDQFAVGDRVIVTGWAVGERYFGGLSQRAKVRPGWCVKCPEDLRDEEVMALGTAGLTAMLCVMALEEAGVKPSENPVVVSGAAGGVGSIAVHLLSQLGYRVAGITGRPETEAYLKQLGASEVIPRAHMAEPCRPLEKQRFSGAVDTVGGPILARLIAETEYGGCVAACGLAATHDLPTTVMPFILRNVRLQGVDSVSAPLQKRVQAWHRLSDLMNRDILSSLYQVISLAEVSSVSEQILAGQVQGRVVVDVNR
jgi:acrylyl-CoA reductase (NADPH)